ncbi:MAG: metallophosphoesterase family protein, partial [Candidatus Sumerlaeota bacterium]|nr:metallophosphoesterase family protein [Candidatus Sumerlaeota bacterium]
MRKRFFFVICILAIWGAFAAVGRAASIAKGPYLIYPNVNTQMTVLWQLDSTSACTLEWGLDTSYSAGSTATSEYGASHQHKSTITGLTPGSLYYYRVTFGSIPYTYTGSFRAAPPASAANVKFLAYGDTRSNPDLHDSVCAAINTAIAADPEYQTFLVHVGDWVATGENEANWTNEYFNRSWPNAIGMQTKIPIMGCLGNHEGAGTLFQKYWPYPFVAHRYHAFDYGPAHFAIVDQYADFSAGSTQLTWLNTDLNATTKEWKFIVLHEPGWSAAGGHANNTLVQSLIQPLCLANGVDIVFGGHNHYYARCDVSGVHHITTGGGGAP